MRHNPKIAGSSVAVDIELYDDGEQLWLYDPEDQDRTYAVVWYGSRRSVAAHARETDGKLAAAIVKSRHRTVAYIDSVEVSSSLREQGLGRSFVDLILRELAVRKVRVVWLNAFKSEDFWLKMGFVSAPSLCEWMIPGMRRELP